MKTATCARAFVVALFLIASPSRAEPEADAAFLAEATINDSTLKLMRSIVMPLTEATLRKPHQGQLLTERARQEYLAIFDEQFDYLLRKDMLAAQQEIYLKLYSPDELAKIRTLFESDAWAIMQSRTQTHQQELATAATAMSNTISKYMMARLETRARNEKFEIFE